MYVSLVIVTFEVIIVAGRTIWFRSRITKKRV
jgi:hypothetical protein